MFDFQIDFVSADDKLLSMATVEADNLAAAIKQAADLDVPDGAVSVEISLSD